MNISDNVISQFAKMVNANNKKAKVESTMYGTAVIKDGKTYVRLDGSELDTPVITTADIQNGERVTVLIKNHEAIVTGNISSPAARTDDVQYIGNVEGLINGLQQSVDDINGSLSTHREDIDNLQRSDSDINDRITEMGDQITSILDEIALIKERLDSLTGDTTTP